MKTEHDMKIGQAGQAEGAAQSGKRKTKLYNVAQVGGRIDELRASEMRPLDATVHALRDRLASCLADGYSITDIVEMLQSAGIDGTDRQLRYALDRAGIHRRQTRRGRTAAVRRQAAQANAESAAPEGDAEDAENVQDAACTAVDGVQDGDASSPAVSQTSVSAAVGTVQAGGVFGDADPQANALNPQVRRPSWTPRPGALSALANADTNKLDKYRELNERRGRQ